MLKVNNDWRIDSDPRNWILQKRSVSKEDPSKESWLNEGYYPTLPAVVRALVDKNIKMPGEITDIVNRLGELYRLIDTRFGADTSTSLPERPKEGGDVETDDLDDLLS